MDALQTQLDLLSCQSMNELTSFDGTVVMWDDGKFTTHENFPPTEEPWKLYAAIHYSGNSWEDWHFCHTEEDFLGEDTKGLAEEIWGEAHLNDLIDQADDLPAALNELDNDYRARCIEGFSSLDMRWGFYTVEELAEQVILLIAEKIELLDW